MNAREDWDNTTRQAWNAAVDAAEAGRWTARDQAELNRVLTAEAQQHLPPNWQAWADENTPEDHPIPDAVALVVVAVLALVVPTLIVVAAWHWLVQ